MSEIRVGVVRGGPSKEYEVSLKTGSAVLSSLPKHKYLVHDILISKEGIWHFHGVPKLPVEIFPHIDVVFNAMHGTYGEDGQVQRLFDQFKIPYTGSGAFPSAISMNKLNTKKYIENLNIKTPKHKVIEVRDDIRDQIVNTIKLLGLPLIIKPVSGGSSVGITLAKTEDEFAEGIRTAFENDKQILVEEYIEGKEATCGVVDSFRNEKYYSLIPVEIIPNRDNLFFDYGAKYNNESIELCPGNFTSTENEELQRLAKEIHEHLDLRHYSRSDFIVSKDGIYFLEVNTLPGLTQESLIPKALSASSITLPEFLDHIVETTLKNK